MKGIDVVIETPKGSTEKYDYDKDSRFFRMKKILPSGMVFPYDFGFIPNTKGEDGDPLDVIVLSEFKSFPGIMMNCRIIGAFKAEQSEEAGKSHMIRNDRFLAIPFCSNIFEKIISLDDLPGNILKELEDFFINYNQIEGKKFKVLKKMDAKKAKNQIREN